MRRLYCRQGEKGRKTGREETLSGDKTNYSSSVFPLVYTIISVVFAFKNTKDVSHSSSDTPPDPPPDQFATIVKNTDELELGNIPSNTPDDQIDNVDDTNLWNLIVGSVPTCGASEIPQANTLRQCRKQPEIEPNTLSKGKTTSEQFDDQIKNTYEKVVLKLEGLYNNNARSKAMKNICSISVSLIVANLMSVSGVYNLTGVASVLMDEKNNEMTVRGEMDPVAIVSSLSKLCHAEIVSVESA
ncbi:hypothetical protein JRO89_XS02G0257300 [Xanthoceras sorbifolium]|uniref:Uncharacterized protein n=1 Tax=Xanthoceras sorbifolium TaxID=99658 RepID=A0ABQ8IGY2_9ROSI|nr:hypothetical protein JRO89_XS02G0257300 [Xanthoceras sorbifolium]